MTIITGTSQFQQMFQNQIYEVVRVGDRNFIMPVVKLSGDSQILSTLENAGHASPLNSTSEPLATGTSFTGEWEDVSDYESVTVATKTDQDGQFAIQFSPNGSDVDGSLLRYYRIGQIEPPHRFSVTRQYMRIIFTNTGDSAQSYLRLQTLLNNIQPLNIPVDSVMSQDYDAVATRPTDYKHEVALGRRQGSVLWNKFGYNNDVDTGTEVVASFGGSFTPLTTPTTLTIDSTSPQDSPGGTGCKSLYIYGIDENRDIQEELVPLNGTGSVTTASLWLGINREAMFLCGASQGNVGTITTIATTTGSVMAQMPAGEGVTQQCIFHVPRNYQFVAEWLRINSLKQTNQNPRITVKMWVYSALSNGKQEVYKIDMDTSVANDVSEDPNLPFPISEQTVIWLEATTDKDDTIVNARFSGIIVRDVDA
jgi:hypothetical protein